MKKIILPALLLMSVLVQAKSNIQYKPMLQQSILYFSSDRVTLGGFGMGAGVHFSYKQNYIVQTDASLLWANGNAVSTRLALGYQRSGKWAPAIMGTFGLLWGQRTEILDDSGQRPIAPVWVAGLRGAPLRLSGERGYVSAMEIGYGIAPYRGSSIELTILSVGMNW